MYNNIIHAKFTQHKSLNFANNQPWEETISLDNLGLSQLEVIKTFQFVKLNAVRMKLVPRYNAVGNTVGGWGTTNVIGQNQPNFVSLFVNNRDQVYPTVASIHTNPRHRKHMHSTIIDRFTRIRPQIDVQMTKANITFTPNKNWFMASSDVQATFGRFLIGTEATPPNDNTVIYDFYYTYYVTLKSLGTNHY